LLFKFWSNHITRYLSTLVAYQFSPELAAVSDLLRSIRAIVNLVKYMLQGANGKEVIVITAVSSSSLLIHI